MKNVARLRTNLRVLDRMDRRDEAAELRRVTAEAESLVERVRGLDSDLLTDEAARRSNAAALLLEEAIWELRLGARA